MKISNALVIKIGKTKIQIFKQKIIKKMMSSSKNMKINLIWRIKKLKKNTFYKQKLYFYFIIIRFQKKQGKGLGKPKETKAHEKAKEFVLHKLESKEEKQEFKLKRF